MKKNRLQLPKKKVGIALLGMLLFGMVFCVLSEFQNHTDYDADMNWQKFNYQTSSLSEIESVCGTNLLLDKMILQDDYFANYILCVSEEYTYSVRENWRFLRITINYGENEFDVEGSQFYCLIAFEESSCKNPIQKILEKYSPKECIFNDVKLTFLEVSNIDAESIGLDLGSSPYLYYHGFASFSHDNTMYYISTDSNERDFFKRTLSNLLA